VVLLRVALRGDDQAAASAVQQVLGDAAGSDRAERGMVGRAEHDQIGLSLLGQRLKGVRRRALLDVDDGELAPVPVHYPLGEHERVLAPVVLLEADDDLWI
jgi:hypothetical protein